MATSSRDLPILAAIFPDGSTNNAAPQLQRVKSSAADPAPHFVELLFDASTNEHAWWQFQMAANYLSGGTVRLLWKANTTTSSNVVWGAKLGAITPADTDTPNEHAPAAASTTTTAVNTTEARREIETTITLANLDSVAANDLVLLLVYRDAANGSDTCSVDAELVTVTFEYTS